MLPARSELVRTLAAVVRERYPRATSAILVGSYAFGRPYVDDLDVSVFDPKIDADGEVNEQFEGAGLRIDVAHRNPAWLSPARAHEGEALFRMRELRKVIAGIVLFDDRRELEEAIPFWRAFEVPIELVEPFFRRVAAIDLRAAPRAERRLAFDLGLETMLLGWLHSEMRFRFSKPKWLLWDIEQLGSTPLAMLVRAVTSELARHLDVSWAISELSRYVPRGSAGESCRKSLHDARCLVAHGESEAAVWPLRMAARDLAAMLARELGVPYKDLRSVAALLDALAPIERRFHDVLLAALAPFRDVPSEWVDLFELARRDYATCIERRRPRVAA
jgi:hypothetical protein